MRNSGQLFIRFIRRLVVRVINGKGFKVPGDDVCSDGVKLLCTCAERELYRIATAISHHSFALLWLLDFVFMAVCQSDQTHGLYPPESGHDDYTTVQPYAALQSHCGRRCAP